MTDWFTLYKTCNTTSNEQHLSNPTCNTQNDNKNSQTPLLSNTFAVPSYQHASYRSRAGGQHKLVCCEHKPKGVANARERCWWVLISVTNVILHGIQENRGHVDELIREVQKLPGLTNLRWATPSFEQHFFSANRSVAQKRCYCIYKINSRDITETRNFLVIC